MTIDTEHWPKQPDGVEPEIFETAACWFIDLIKAKSTDEHWPQFDSWLHASPEHYQAYLWLEKTWDAVGNVVQRRYGERSGSSGSPKRCGGG